MPWFDGELLVGAPNAPGVLRRTQAGVSSADGDPDWTYYIFDTCDPTESQVPFTERLKRVEGRLKEARHKLAEPGRLMLLDHRTINGDEQLWAFEQECVSRGYEGIMVRDPMGLYKWGRSTVREGGLIKFKRWEDAECIVLEAIEQLENTNEKTVNPLGKSERSSHKANKIGKNTLGGYKCKTYWAEGGPESGRFDLNNPEGGEVIFWCGAAANQTADELQRLWDNRELLPERIFTFTYQFRLGVDAPQHPTFKVWEVEGER